MSEQKIEAPSAADVDSIARALVHVDQVAEQVTGSKMDGTRNDLALIQVILDRRLIEREATYTLQALGLAFGRAFIHENKNFDWWMVEDKHGRDPAIRYKSTNLLAFPRTIISNRIEDGESPDIVELFDSLTLRLEELAEDGQAPYPGQVSAQTSSPRPAISPASPPPCHLPARNRLPA